MLQTFKARPYAEIAEKRRADILAGAKIHPKGACWYCAWPFQAKELYCSADCAQSYEAERVELTAPKAG